MPESSIHRLFSELKRRRVFRVAGVYAVVAWAVIEVAETIFPILMLPGWLLTAVTVLALLGLPLAVVLAWGLEMTPDGVKRTPAARETAPGGAWGAPTLLGLAVVVLITGAAGYYYLRPPGPSVGPDDRSIAVLPFDNLSGDPENEYFSDGITEDILTNLAQIGDLRVISRTSVMTYKDSEKTIPEIARELEVAYVLEGSVRRAGGRVRVTAQLIHAATDDHVWAESYDRRLTDIFGIQSEVAHAIGQELQAELSTAVRNRIETAPTTDLRAYESFLKGRALLDQRTAEPVRQAIDFFQGAIERDSSYGLAWAGLADALSLLTYYDYAIPDSVPPALEAAGRAVELAPELGQTHASLGIAHSLRQEGPAALQELERAIGLTPSYAEAQSWLGWVRLMTGSPEQAVRPAEEAVELDPLAPAYRAYLSEIRLANRDLEGALPEARRAAELQPEYGFAHFMEGLTLYHMGRHAEARSALERAKPMVPPRGTPSHVEIDAALALVRIAAGDRAGAREVLANLAGRSDDPDARFATGIIHAALGDLDAAFDALGQVEAWGSLSNENLRYFFPDALADLRSDARYPALLGQVDRAWGLPPDGGA